MNILSQFEDIEYLKNNGGEIGDTIFWGIANDGELYSKWNSLQHGCGNWELHSTRMLYLSIREIILIAKEFDHIWKMKAFW